MLTIHRFECVAGKIKFTCSAIIAVMAIELIVACQAIDLRQPKKLSGPLRDVYDIVRKHIR